MKLIAFQDTHVYVCLLEKKKNKKMRLLFDQSQYNQETVLNIARKRPDD